MKRMLILLTFILGLVGFAEEPQEIIVYRTPAEKWQWDMWIDSMAWLMTGYNWVYVFIPILILTIIICVYKSFPKKKRRSRW